jgi:hypothetical protein
MLIGLKVNDMFEDRPFTGLHDPAYHFFGQTINQVNQAFVLVL